MPILDFLKKHASLLVRILPLIAFAIPILWLYLIDAGSFELMWKGRTFQLFFIWLIALELVLSWEGTPSNGKAFTFSKKTAVTILALALPTLFVVLSNYGGLNGAITSWALQSRIPWANSMALATEYLVFAVLFCLIVTLMFGFKGLKEYSVPAFFVALVGVIYTIDNVYPYGQFTPFQIFVPTTTSLAAAFLNMMGYATNITYGNDLFGGLTPSVTVTDPTNLARNATFAIAWPCAGIESFLIFTVVVLLFLKRMPISLRTKVGYFVFGAAVTFVINSLRIVNIFMLGMAYGETSSEVQLFHFYYGPLYAIAWIVAYPLIIMFSLSLWRTWKRRNQKKPSGPAITADLSDVNKLG